MKVCAVIPAFNNETTIAKVVEGARAHLEQVLVIDDGSTDDTPYAAADAGAQVIRVSKNRGKGNALRVAFRFARENGLDAIVTMDADLQHDPHEIPRFLDRHRKKGAKIVVGNRMWDKKNIPPIRYAPNKIGTVTFSWLIGQPIEDSQCGFRFYGREVMDHIPIVNDGFEAEADILLRAGKRGYGIDFVPIKAVYFSDPQHRSYYRNVRDTFRISIIFLMNLFWKTR
jgi:glycosyltransferase involved in cell wall biosynthesis